MGKEGIYHVDPASLGDLQTRVEYLKRFIGFTEDDAAALHASAPIVGPLVPAIVDAVYEKLLSFDITAKSFVPQQTGYSGEVPTKVEDLSQTHPMIRFRKDFLSHYLVKLVTMDYQKLDSWVYLDNVGLMHTGRAGFAYRISKPALRVDYIHCAILLGYVEDILVQTVVAHPDLDVATKTAVTRAANKIIWLQNDLFARHYIRDSEAEATNACCIDKSIRTVTVALGLVAAGAGLMHFFGRHFL